MEWAFEILDYLPKAGLNEQVNDYIQYHASELDKSIDNEIEMWIYIHTHILYMVFIYFQLLRISQVKEKEFRYSWIGLANNEKEFRKDNLNPFSFSSINEKTVFRFFRLIHFDDGFIWDISQCVNGRNDVLHASWNHISELDKKVEKYLRNMGKIVEQSQEFLQNNFKKFRDDNASLFEEWYEVGNEDLESDLYIPYYLSIYELGKLTQWEKTWKVIEAIKEDIE